jgi:small subunit ribosomal protein S16
MLAIRLQRLGRKALPIYRLAVQESQRHPTSGRVVAYVGSYNPHTKDVTIDKEKVAFYLQNGAQPTPRVIRVLQSEKVELPAWVKVSPGEKKRSTRKPEKLRKNQPKEEPPAEAAAAPEASEAAESSTADQQ